MRCAVICALGFVSHAVCAHAKLLIESDNNRMCRCAAGPTASARLHLTRAPAMGCIASTLGGEAGSTARSASPRSRVRGGGCQLCCTHVLPRTCSLHVLRRSTCTCTVHVCIYRRSSCRSSVSVHPGTSRPSRQFIGKAESIPIPARVDIPLDPGVPELALQVHDHLPVGT